MTDFDTSLEQAAFYRHLNHNNPHATEEDIRRQAYWQDVYEQLNALKVKDKPSHVLQQTFTHYSDLEKGWLEVNYADIKILDIEKEITQWSYRNNDKVYLEDDIDAWLFIKAWLKYHERPENDFTYFKNHHKSHSQVTYSLIRSFPHYHHE